MENLVKLAIGSYHVELAPTFESAMSFDFSEQELLTMLEAARWAASSYNAQPWRFIYARRDTAHWPKFLDLLVPFN